mmetsp:Transcript_85750/g.276751  ORF Transcript_85750/g.276751 Transcript_85750/m.276751 type:complete len:366 (-) Transcript_85750:155-1252(-)
MYRGQDTASTEPDATVQAFTQWLAELRSKSGRSQQDMLSEMGVIRDGISTNNVELTEFKRNSTGISQQMQGQLTDLREKLTSAFSEITNLIKLKSKADNEMMQDVNMLGQSLSSTSSELEALKRSYSQAHQHLQTSLIQIQNHIQVTNNEVQIARASCDRAYRDATLRFAEFDDGLKVLEDRLMVGNADNRSQMLGLQNEVARIHESMAQVSADFLDYKRSSNSVHNKLQSQVWGLEEGSRRVGAQRPPPMAAAAAGGGAHSSYQPPGEPTAMDPGAATTMNVQYAGMTSAAGQYSISHATMLAQMGAARYSSMSLPQMPGAGATHMSMAAGTVMQNRGSINLPAHGTQGAQPAVGYAQYRHAGL